MSPSHISVQNKVVFYVSDTVKMASFNLPRLFWIYKYFVFISIRIMDQALVRPKLNQIKESEQK